MNTRQSAVRVFPHDGMWFVGCGAGYYNYPMGKAEAIRKALSIAEERVSEGAAPLEVEVRDELGNILEVINANSAAQYQTGEPKAGTVRASGLTPSHLLQGVWPRSA